MNTALITGGAGFLGANLCRKLLNQGMKVIALDNLYTGRKRNIEELEGNPDFRFVEWDVREPFSFDVREVYHLAAPASPPHYQKDPVFTLETIVDGTRNALKCAQETGASIVIASTSEIYGDPLVHPQTESYYGNVNTTGPRSCYDEGKRCAETFCMEYHNKYGVDAKIVRIFNTYGPFMDPDDRRVVTEFVTAMLQNRPVRMHGDGSQTRSFCYVEDLLEGMVRVLRGDEYTPINIGNPAEITVRQLADTVASLLGVEYTCDYHPFPKDDPVKRRPDISKAKELFGWEPVWRLEDGLCKIIEYLRRELSV